jgi:hypothetical protein
MEIIEGSVRRVAEIQKSKETNGRWVPRETAGTKGISSPSSTGIDTSNDLPSISPDKSSGGPQSTQDIIKSLNSGL